MMLLFSRSKSSVAKQTIIGHFGPILPALAFVCCFFLLPAVHLVQLSLQPQSGMSSQETALTLQNYVAAVSEPVYLATFLRSIRFAVESTAICFAVAYPLAWLLLKVRPFIRTLVLTTVSIPLVLNLLTSSFAWIVMLQRKGVINWALGILHISDEPIGLLFTEGATLVGMIYVVFPLMILPVFGALRSIDPAYSEAARVLGAGPLRTFFQVAMPLSLPGALVGSLLVFIASFGLYLVPELLGGPAFTLLPYLIQQQTLYFLNWPMAAALSIILILAVMPALVLVQRLLWKIF